MTVAYPFRFSEEDGGFWARGIGPFAFVFTQADTMDELRTNAQEALSLAIAYQLDEGETVPRPWMEADAEAIEPDAATLAPLLLRWAREDAKLTQVELAKRLGIAQPSYAKLERSGANPSVKTLSRVAKALGRRLQIAL